MTATVVTVATATHKATVHHKLVNSHTGFASVVELETPRARQRYAMMEKIFSRLGCVYSTRRESSGKEGSTSSNFVMDDTIVQRTEGYRPADLDLLCKRAMRIAATRTICRAQAALHRDTLIITEVRAVISAAIS
jgi:SpoVK/Ycf46/Vps4 family AAA+-type ATPase